MLLCWVGVGCGRVSVDWLNRGGIPCDVLWVWNRLRFIGGLGPVPQFLPWPEAILNHRSFKPADNSADRLVEVLARTNPPSPDADADASDAEEESAEASDSV